SRSQEDAGECERKKGDRAWYRAPSILDRNGTSYLVKAGRIFSLNNQKTPV
ncbi:hypothetical protein K0M31_007337, partial [Melipona bicolor]